MTSIADFQEYLGVPSFGALRESDWSDFLSRFSVSLPGDYCEFVSAYGPGCIADTLLIFHPCGARDDGSLSLITHVELTGEAYGALREEFPQFYPYPVFPENGGLFPIARTSTGNQLFMQMGAGGGVSMVADFQGRWEVWRLGFTGFLLRAVSGTLEPPFFDESVLSEISFEICGSLD